jgi:hypothetical protein
VRRHGAEVLGVLSAGSICVPGLAEACSVCVGPGSESRGLGAGFYWSALLLTLLPFVLAAALVVSMGRIWRHRGSGPPPEARRPPVSDEHSCPDGDHHAMTISEREK